MILYNITINVEKSAHDTFMNWIKTYHVPTIMGTGLFHENKILKLLNEDPESAGITYAFQYFTKDMQSLEKYQQDFEPAIISELYKKFKEQFVEFRTVLEEVG